MYTKPVGFRGSPLEAAMHQCFTEPQSPLAVSPWQELGCSPGNGPVPLSPWHVCSTGHLHIPEGWGCVRDTFRRLEGWRGTCQEICPALAVSLNKNLVERDGKRANTDNSHNTLICFSNLGNMEGGGVGKEGDLKTICLFGAVLCQAPFLG